MRNWIMNKRIHGFALAGLLSLGASGCSTAPHKVELVTEPAGASVYVNGELVGASPKIVSLPFDKFERVWVQVSLAGFAHQENKYTLDEVEGQSQIVLKLVKQ